MKNTIRVLSIIALVISLIWLLAIPGYAPALAIVVFMIGLISSCIMGNDGVNKIKQSQKLSELSWMQAEGNINNNTKSKED